MILWILPFFIFGGLIGFFIGRKKRKTNYAGTLREDHSDPTEAPYLFLELEPGGLDKIHQSSEVTFKVKLENYIRQKGDHTA